MAKMTPEQEARYALNWDLPRSDLSVAAQLEYERLRPVWEQDVAARLAREPTEIPHRGLPDRWVRRLADIGAITALILGIVCAGLAIINFLPHYKRTGGLVALGAVAGLLAMILALVVAAAEEKNKQPRTVGRMIIVVVVIAGGMLGLVGSIILTPVWCPNCTGLLVSLRP